jgi:hypothetical protein
MRNPGGKFDENRGRGPRHHGGHGQPSGESGDRCCRAPRSLAAHDAMRRVLDWALEHDAALGHDAAVAPGLAAALA